jgi:hypothetical protein
MLRENARPRDWLIEQWWRRRCSLAHCFKPGKWGWSIGLDDYLTESTLRKLDQPNCFCSPTFLLQIRLYLLPDRTKASFRCWKNFSPMNSTTFVLFDKYCPIVDQLGSKDSSRDFQLNCVISYFFTYI